MSDCAFIREIISEAAGYKNNLPYSIPRIIPIPGFNDGAMSPGEHNSNSFVAGILQAIGAHTSISTLGTFQVPGFDRPTKGCGCR
jgi:hypothetical protein